MMGDVSYDLIQRVIDWQLRSRFPDGIVVDCMAGNLEDKLVWALDNQERVLISEIWRLRSSGYSRGDISVLIGVDRRVVDAVLCGYSNKGRKV